MGCRFPAISDVVASACNNWLYYFAVGHNLVLLHHSWCISSMLPIHAVNTAYLLSITWGLCWLWASPFCTIIWPGLYCLACSKAGRSRLKNKRRLVIGLVSSAMGSTYWMQPLKKGLVSLGTYSTFRFSLAVETAVSFVIWTVKIDMVKLWWTPRPCAKKHGDDWK